MGKKQQYHPWRFLKETSGEIAVASLLICLITGIVLAIPFDISAPYSSLSTLVVANPYGSLFRNLHYWSAQIFLVFSLIHVVDYIRQRAERDQKAGMWTRLIIMMAVAIFAMLSGFMLKADAESLQAHRILTSLMQGLPWGGGLMASAFLGNENDLQLVYVHHIATSSIFIAVVVFEHLRRIWSGWRAFGLTLALVSLLGLIITAPLHDNINSLLKGPWYFLGLQELLHWMNRPEWSWLLVLAVFVALLALRKARRTLARMLRYSLLILGAAYLVLSLTGFFFRGVAWEWVPPWKPGQLDLINPYKHGPVSFNSGSRIEGGKLHTIRTGARESCLACHTGMSGFSPSHDPAAIGCYSCHRGNPLSPNKDLAHRGMLRVPGNLGHALITCGSTGCHPEITQRVTHSIMATLSGMIQVNRYAFGESDTLDALLHVSGLGQTAADNHFRNLCASCHLGNPKTEPGPMDMTALGGGCNACHLDYHPQARDAFMQWQLDEGRDTTWPRIHPRLTVDIPDERCFGCHSRSGRISTSYEGWHETLLAAHEAHGVDSLRVLDDRRVFRFIKEDVHHKAGMRCVDCHISWELMGDGKEYAHKEDQTRVRCTDCHFNGKPRLLAQGRADFDLQRLGPLKGFNADTLRMLRTEKGEYGLYNTSILPDGKAVLIGKGDRRLHPLNPPGKFCSEGTVHKNLDCATCHTSWAPGCIGCHNAYDPKVTAFDHLKGRFVKGGWDEYNGKFLADLPTLGVRQGPEGDRFVTAIPGMVLTIDRSSYEGGSQKPVFRRLFAPASAHTIQKEGIGCKECHSNPHVLGFGRGELSLRISGSKAVWEFTPKYALREEDRLPEDAWTGFLDGRSGGATRSSLRPLNSEEQRRLLRVGACLSCHADGSAVALQSLAGFEAVLKRMSPRCVDTGDK